MANEKELIGGSYDRCLTCKYLGDGCDGPNPLAMTHERMCEWFGLLARIRGYTLTFIAQRAKVSLKTVERVIKGEVSKGIRLDTAAAIMRVLVGSTGKFPCAVALLDEAPDAVRELRERNTELERLRATLAGIHAAHQTELERVREEARAKIDYLKVENEKKDRIINRLLDRSA